MTPLAFVLLLFAPQITTAQPDPAAEQRKQVSALVEQIVRLAASEPAVYGVDTRIKTADLLTKPYPKMALELLNDGRGELAGVNVPEEQDRLRVRLVRAYAPLDLEEAERLAAALRRGADIDYVAEAYDQLYQYFEKQPDDARRIIHHGLAAGAFRMVSASRQLEDWKSKDQEAARGLFSEMLGAFPVESPHAEDVLYLLYQTRKILTLSRALAVQGIDKSLSATNSESLRFAASEEKDKSPPAVRDRLLREIVSTLRSLDPDLLERYKDQHKELDLAPLPVPKPAPREKEAENTTVDYANLPYADALSRARKLEDTGDKAGALIEISRREDLTAQQRTSVSLEALGVTAKMAALDDRLVGLAMISRDFARRGEMANAAFAARMLSEDFSKDCDCPLSTCTHDKFKFDCMQNVEDFAEYLDEFKISPESMDLQNISLEARLLVLKLYALLNPKESPRLRLGQ